jgi:hypothetical protein
MRGLKEIFKSGLSNIMKNKAIHKNERLLLNLTAYMEKIDLR